jgi:enoyl-CoA hydratase
MSTDDVLLSVQDHIATVTLNRPEARNALNRSVIRGLRFAMAQADADDEVRAIILTGTDPAFCAGVDLKELASGNSGVINTGNTENTSESRPETGVIAPPWNPTTKPVIGAVNGVAITGGFELALQCDFLVASERAAFGDTHARVGILPGWGLSVLLPQAIGLRRAIEMSLTGNFLGATEALQLGLVNHVTEHDQLLPTARKLATDIATNNTPAIRTLLASYRAIHLMTVADGLTHELQVNRDYMKAFSAADFAKQRAAITDRGRSQIT